VTNSAPTLWSLPGLRVVARLGPVRVLRVLAVLYVIGFIVAVLTRESIDPLATGRDPVTYLAAGERLNAGHPLYALPPGDREVPLSPPYWSVPLLAPPPIAVLWRPLALFGEAAALAWWLGGVVAIAGFVVWLLARGTVPVLLATVVLTPALALTAVSGNTSAYLIPLMAGAWVWRERPWVVGPIVVIAAAVKLTPGLFVVWLVAARRWREFGAAAVSGAVIGVVSIAGAGLEAYVEWIRWIPSSAPMPLSLAASFGLPPLVVAASVGSFVAAGVFVAARRHREDAMFSMAAIGAAIATPSLYFAAVAALILAVSPSRPR